MPFFLYTSPDMEILAKVWNSYILKNPLSDPFQSEIIVTQTDGMSKWLSLRMADHIGICSNVRFIKPNTLFNDIFRPLLGFEGNFRDSPFYSDNLVWPIFSVLISGFLKSKDSGPLPRYCRNEVHTLECSRMLADLFDQYSFYRPELLDAWENGNYSFKDNQNEIWQMNLWNKILHDFGRDNLITLKIKFKEKLNSTEPEEIKKIAGRLCIFGVSSLPPFHLDIVMRLSNKIPVFLFLFTPFPVYSENTKENLFLISNAGMGREFLKEVIKIPGVEHEHIPAPAEKKKFFLSILKDDLLQGMKTKNILPDDTLLISSCHGVLRELQVLRDYLLSVFSADNTLSASDIAVMSPAIEEYTPWIESVFGRSSEFPMPYSMTDRNTGCSNETAEAYLSILSLPGSRFESEKIFSLLENPFISRRFSLNNDEMAEIRKWLKVSRIYWGLNQSHKKSFGCPETPENTWKSGLERLMAGIALIHEKDRYFEGISPVDGIEGEKIDLFARFFSFIKEIDSLHTQTEEMRTLEEWSILLLHYFECFLKLPQEKEHEGAFIKNIIAKLGGWGIFYKGKIGYPALLNQIRSILSHSSSSSGYLNGGINFCSLLPMRSVPFRIICILGLQASDFPRKQPRFGFDLSTLEERALDRNLSQSEKYLFLEALFSAKDRIYFSFQGHNIQDNSPREMSLPLASLMDYISDNYFPAEKLLTEQPLQTFSTRYADARETGIITYSAENQEIARKLSVMTMKPRITSGRERKTVREKLNNIELKTDDLIRFFHNPAKYYLHNILKLAYPAPLENIASEEPFVPDGLDEYSIFRDFTLDDKISLEASAEKYYAGLRSEGRLPHGALGKAYFNYIFNDIMYFHADWRKNTGMPVPELEINKVFNIGGTEVSISGKIGNLYEAGLFLVRPAKNITPRDRVDLWMHDVLFNCTVMENYSHKAGFISREKTLFLNKIPEPDKILYDLLELYLTGIKEILPFIPSASEAFYHEFIKHPDPAGNIHKAEKVWFNEYNRENQDPYFKTFISQYDIFDIKKEISILFMESAKRFYKPFYENVAVKNL